MRRCFSIAATLVLLAAVSRDARAADPDAGLSLERLDRPEPGSRFYATDTLTLRDPWRPAFGLQTNYDYRPFSVIEPDGNRSTVVRNVWSMDAAASIVIPGNMRFGLSLPFVVFQNGHDTQIGTSAVSEPWSPAAGDLRISGDVLMVGDANDPFSFTLGVAVFLPSGSRQAFTGDETARVYPRALMTGKIKQFRWGARAGYMLRPHDAFLGAVQLGSEALVGGSAGVEVGSLVFGPEIFGSTVVSSDPFKTETTPVEVLLGAHYAVTPTLIAGTGVGTRLSDGIGAAWFRAVASFEYVPRQEKHVKDRDKDGVPDEEDICPDVPGCDPLFPGCPAPLVDTNGNGIPETEIECNVLPGNATHPLTRRKGAKPAPAPAPPPVTPTPPAKARCL